MATQSTLGSAEALVASAPAAPSAPWSRVSLQLVDTVFAIVFLLLPPLIYLPYLKHNLPVASHWDERSALEVLLRFHQGSLNPHFFMYPTLYFYCLHVLLLPFSYSNAKAMIVGRLFNIVLIGATAFITYALCRDHLHSRATGAVAALFVLGSTVLSGVASYIHPDMLMTATGTAALYYLARYSQIGGWRSWALGMTLIGLSVGCKYTAFVLYIAYFFTEALLSLRSRNDPVLGSSGKVDLEARFSRNLCVITFASLGLWLILLAAFFPVARVLHLVTALRSNLETKPETYYLDFFRHIRSSLLQAGALLACMALLCRFSRPIYRAVSLKRLYYGLAIVLLLSVLSTPFGVLHPKAFLFDLGALARTNLVVAGGHAQATTYAVWLVQREGPLFMLLSLAGLAAIAIRMERRFTIVAVYLALYLCILATSQLGFVRYLAPVVPLFAIGAAVAVAKLWNGSASNHRHDGTFRWTRAVAVPLLLGAFIQTGMHIAHSRWEGRRTNACFDSYWAARKATSGTAFYAGYAPSIELSEAGVKTTQLTWPALIGTPMGTHLVCGDVLILDQAHATQYHLYPLRDDSVTMLLDAPGQQGQVVLQRSHCPAIRE